MLVVLILLLGGVVFVIMNRPANLMIRKSFTALTGLELVNTKEYDQMRAENVLLEQQQISRQFIIDSLISTANLMQKELTDKEIRNQALEAREKTLTKQLAQAKEAFDAMIITERLVDFDLLTDGSKPTFLSEYQGHEVAIAEPSRIADAAWKIHEGNTAKETVQIQAERIEVISDQLSIVQNINAHIGAALQREQEQGNDEVQKRQNCEQAQTNTLKKAKGIAGGGIISFIVAVAILIL